MCCCKGSHGGKYQSHHHHGDSCACACEGKDFGPAFWTDAEKIAWLEQYRDELQEEMNTVEKRIAAIKQEK